MRDGSFYDKLSELNGSLYHKDFEDWKLITTYSHPSGLFIALYNAGNSTIFAIKGTDVLDTHDWNADINLANKKIPSQYYAADKFYKQIQNTYSNIIFTGYSLGGSIAQMLGNEYNKETICFAPFGVGDIVKPKHTSCIINFGNIYDIVFMSNLDKQLGILYIMPVDNALTDKPGVLKHFYKFYGKPSQAKEYTGPKNRDSLYKQLTRVKEDPSKYVKKGLVQADNYLHNIPSKLTKEAKKSLSW